MVAAAGCFGGEEGVPSNVEVQASQPLVAQGWSQDGAELSQATGQARLLADDADGSGSLAANLTVDGTRYELSADTFRAQDGQAWMDDGVNQTLALHGDTQRGTSQLPRVDATVATWGPIVLTRDGEIVPDPLTDASELTGHAFLTEEGIRSDEDGTMRTEDGAVYGPSQAGSGASFPGDPELHVIVTSDPDATAPDDQQVEDSGSFEPPEATVEVPFPVERLSAAVNVTIEIASATDEVLTPAEANATLLDPDGSTVRAASLGVQAENSVAWRIEDVPATGEYTVELSSQGSADWTVQADVSYPQPLVFHATYEGVEWGDASP